MVKELIIAVTEHRKFGYVFSAYIISPSEGNTFYSSIEKANNINLTEVEGHTNTHVLIVKLISEYDDNYIANLFTKKKDDAREFIKNVDNEFILNRIRPHIEKRVQKIMPLLAKADLKIYYKDRKYSKIYRSDEIMLADDKAEAVFNFNRHSDGLDYYLTINHNNENIKLINKKGIVLANSPCVFVLNNNLYSFTDIDSKKLTPFFEKEAIKIPKQTEKTYFEKFVLNTINSYTVNAQGFNIVESNEAPTPQLHLQNDLAGNPVLLLKYQYASNVILPNNKSKNFVSLDIDDDNYTFFKTFRATKFEEQIHQNLKKLKLSSNDSNHFYPPVNEEQHAIHAIINWINYNSANLKQLGIELKQSFFEQKYYLESIDLKLSVIDNKDWFDIKGYVELAGFKIPFLKLRKNIVKSIPEYELPNGQIVILPPEWFAKYKELFLFTNDTEDGLQLNKMHFRLLNSNIVGVKSDYAEKIKEFFDSSEADNTETPNELNAKLRPYQFKGYNWMKRLKEHLFGGCLADDMGLGKTLQTLTLLLDSSKDEITVTETKQTEKTQLSLFDPPVEVLKRKARPTSLIVMPSSLIYNWFNEIHKFTPNLRALKHVGTNRTKNIANFTNYDIVLTTYGVIRNDIESLSHFSFHYVILDESQVIKNPESKIYKSIIQLKGSHKLVLTGTPIENSLTDLWSQMNFVNRGLLGNYNFFKKEFVAPIEKYADEHKSERLQSLIHPFILRRKKEEVATDLPAKTEQIRNCEMSEAQRKMYEEEKSAVRNELLTNMEKVGVEKSSLMILQALTRLRQLSNHPKLIDSNHDSGKFEEVTRMLENVISEGHKVLIFSSFVQHLELYKTYLENRKLKYSILTGQSQNRQKIIEDFQNDNTNQVFLISLKAGGVGLNLTQADYVFLLDPWWNPAAENQAINRAHRIGQDKKVFVYRFISSGTIEEKIVRLQEKKSELADMFINSNNPFKTMSAEKIKELFN